jgi:hypothetical protein
MANPFKSCFQDGILVPITDMSRPREGTDHAQVTAGGNHGLAHSFSQPRHHMVGIMDPCPWPHVEGPEREFQFPVFKIGTLVFQVVTLAKRQQDSPLLGFCYRLNKAFEVFCCCFFFYDYKGLLP